MSLYFFNLHECGTVVRDEEGRDLDLAAVREIAIKDARFILSSEILNGAICLDCCIIVEDEQRREVMRVPFRDAVSIGGC